MPSTTEQPTPAQLEDSATGTPANLGSLKHRMTAGVATLLLRRVVVQLISLAATTLLMRILSVEEFGIYAIVFFVVTLSGLFADAGLGAALVQRKEEITQEDLDIVFTVQCILLGLATAAIFFAAPWIREQYALPAYATQVLRALSISLLISSLKTVPAIILERRLDYHKLSASDIVELLTFQIVAVSLAVLGMGTWSFVIAALVQAVAGSFVLYLLYPWRPGVSFNFRQARALLRFGGLFQARTLISVVKDQIPVPVLIALTGGSLAVGYVNFALKLSAYPLMVDAAAARVTFPAYSRIQDNLPRLKSGIEKTLKLVNMTLFPLTGLLIVLAEPATRLIFGEKWLPALPALYLYSVAYLTVGTSNVLMNSLYALGRPEPVLRLSIFWAVGTWVLAVPLVLWIGWIGLPVATALLALTNIVLPLREVHKILPVAVMQSVLKPAFGALLSTGLVAMLGTMLNSTVPGLMLNAVCGMTVYIVCILVLDGRWLARELMPSLPHALSTRLLKTPLLGHLLDPSR